MRRDTRHALRRRGRDVEHRRRRHVRLPVTQRVRPKAPRGDVAHAPVAHVRRGRPHRGGRVAAAVPATATARPAQKRSRANRPRRNPRPFRTDAPRFGVQPGPRRAVAPRRPPRGRARVDLVVVAGKQASKRAGARDAKVSGKSGRRRKLAAFDEARRGVHRR